MVLTSATCVVGGAYFYKTNWISDMERLRYALVFGSDLAAQTDGEEVVFTLCFTPDPQTQWYAKRTLFRVDSLPQAKALLRSQGTARGLLISERDGVQTYGTFYDE